MIVYHGSNHCFKKLKIGKSLVERRSTLENEGIGIYFSTDRTVAESYGKYVYEIELENIQDFRKRSECKKYLNEICAFVLYKTKVNIKKYIYFDATVSDMKAGGLSIAEIGKELQLQCDSRNEFYTELSETKRQKIFQCLKTYAKNHLTAYMFQYHIKNIGVIKDLACVKSFDILSQLK